MLPLTRLDFACVQAQARLALARMLRSLQDRAVSEAWMSTFHSCVRLSLWAPESAYVTGFWCYFSLRYCGRWWQSRLKQAPKKAQGCSLFKFSFHFNQNAFPPEILLLLDLERLSTSMRRREMKKPVTTNVSRKRPLGQITCARFALFYFVFCFLKDFGLNGFFLQLGRVTIDDPGRPILLNM